MKLNLLYKGDFRVINGKGVTGFDRFWWKFITNLEWELIEWTLELILVFNWGT